MLNILIDIDGVACDHAASICKWVNAEYQLHSTPEDVTTWDHDFGPVTFVDAVRECYPNQQFVCSMDVSAGFMAFYHTIAPLTKVTFATARTDSREATKEWIEKHFPGRMVRFTQKKLMIPNQDFVLDDYPGECIACAEVGIRSLLIRRPWNQDKSIIHGIQKYPSIVYCNDFDEAFKIIQTNI